MFQLEARTRTTLGTSGKSEIELTLAQDRRTFMILSVLLLFQHENKGPEDVVVRCHYSGQAADEDDGGGCRRLWGA